MDRINILDLLRKSKKYDIALMTTFNFEIAFFERNILNKLYDNGIRKVSLFVDNKEYLKAYEWLIAFVFGIARIFCTKMDFNVPKNNEKIRNRKRSNAIPNNYINAYENRKS